MPAKTTYCWNCGSTEELRVVFASRTDTPFEPYAVCLPHDEERHFGGDCECNSCN